MTFQDLRRLHQGKICICRPHLRDVKSHRVVSWTCLEVVDGIEAASRVLERLDRDGVTDAVPISTTEQITIKGTLAARYIRISLGWSSGQARQLL